MRGFDPERALRPKRSKKLMVAVVLWIITGLLGLASLTYLFYSWTCTETWCENYRVIAIPYALGAVAVGIGAFMLGRTLGPPPQKKAPSTATLEQKPVSEFIGRAR